VGSSSVRSAGRVGEAVGVGSEVALIAGVGDGVAPAMVGVDVAAGGVAGAKVVPDEMGADVFGWIAGAVVALFGVVGEGASAVLSTLLGAAVVGASEDVAAPAQDAGFSLLN